MLLHSTRTDMESLSHLGILHPSEIAHLQYLVGWRCEMSEHLFHQQVFLVGIIGVILFCGMQILFGIMALENIVTEIIDRLVANGGHQIGIHIGRFHMGDVFPQHHKHVVENVLRRLLLVYDVQGIVIQPNIIFGVYPLKNLLICKCCRHIVN